MIEDIIKENTAAVIDLTAAIRELATSGATATPASSGKPSSKSGKAKPAKPAQEEQEEQEEEAGGDLLGGSSEPKVSYDDLRKLAQTAIDAGNVAGLRKIVKDKLKVGSLSELDEKHYAKAYELLTALNDE